jgi:hypothetical protein
MRRLVVGEAANGLSTRGPWPWYGSVSDGFEIRMGVAVGWLVLCGPKKALGKREACDMRGLDGVGNLVTRANGFQV